MLHRGGDFPITNKQEGQISKQFYLRHCRQSSEVFGKNYFRCSVRQVTRSLSMTLTKGLSVMTNSGHFAVQKLWILQHHLVPHPQWPLFIYEIPISVVTKLEPKISFWIRKWFHLHNVTTNVSLYSSSSPCPHSIKHFSSILKSARVSGQSLLWESADLYVSEAKALLQSEDVNWSTLEAVGEAKKKD